MIVWAAREFLAPATLAPSIDDPRHPGQTTPAALRGCRGQGTPGWPGVSVAAIAVDRTGWIGAEGRLRGLTTGGADRAMAPSRSSLRASASGGWARNLATIIGPGGASRIATVALQQLAAAQLRFALDHRRRRAASRLTTRCRLLPSRCRCGVPARRVSPLASPSGHGDGDGLGQVLGVALAIGASVEKSLHPRSEEHTSELQSHVNLVCRLLLEKKKNNRTSRRLRSPQGYLPATSPPRRGRSPSAGRGRSQPHRSMGRRGTCLHSAQSIRIIRRL